MLTSAVASRADVLGSFHTGIPWESASGIADRVDVISHMRAASGAEDQVLRALLGMFGLTGAIAFQDAGTLSGGEKTKLALA